MPWYSGAEILLNEACLNQTLTEPQKSLYSYVLTSLLLEHKKHTTYSLPNICPSSNNNSGSTIW